MGLEGSEEFKRMYGEFSVACHCGNVANGFEWTFAGIYGPNVDNSRRLLWEELAGLIILCKLDMERV